MKHDFQVLAEVSAVTPALRDAAIGACEWVYKLSEGAMGIGLPVPERFFCGRENTAEIDEWLNEDPPDPTKEIGTKSIPVQGPLVGDAVTGRGSTVGDDGKPSKVEDTKGVAIRLLYKPDLNPPYIVFSSMPK
ncbi:hypothetical protein OG501_17770 [Streptomyces niveus]|uniref:hypothetical protein n=1 Tax=Streptomyces niveus TaxID=193462 RepID=UPI003863F147